MLLRFANQPASPGNTACRLLVVVTEPIRFDDKEIRFVDHSLQQQPDPQQISLGHRDEHKNTPLFGCHS